MDSDQFPARHYVGLHGVCFSVLWGLGRESHHLWLGFPFFGSQPTLTPESRHLALQIREAY